MSAIEYNNLLFEISQRLDELNVLDRLLFMCRGKLAPGSEGNTQNVLSLFKELEEQNHLGTDRLEVMKELLKGVREWSLFGKVKKYESTRKEYKDLLDQIIRVLDELNDVQRLVAMCKGKIPEESDGQIQDVRSLFKELENQSNLGIYRLDILKAILIDLEQNDLLKEVEEFEELRNKEDEFERRKAQAAAVVSSVGNTLIGVLNIKTVFKVVAGSITVVSTLEVLSRWSTFDQLVTAVNSCVLPAGTSLVQLTDGCVCLTVRAETLSALTTLWSLYQDGTLKTRLYNFFVTDEVSERAGGEEVEVNVTIEEQEYKMARLELINKVQEAVTFGDEKRIRRNSDSAVYFSRKEEMPLLFIKRAEANSFKQTLEGCKALETEEMDERINEPEKSQQLKVKIVGQEKYAFVQKYVQDVQETHSITTETSDSGYWTHSTSSELGDASGFLDDSEDQVYDGIRDPYVLVINNANFYNSPGSRSGTFYDRGYVRRFVKEAGFRSVTEHFDLRKNEMLDVLELTRHKRALDEHDSCICIIMSHGNKNGILGVDGQAIPVEKITAKLQGDRCPQLANKPKLFFLQACRGDFDNEGGEMPVKPPLDADVLIAFSTTKGYIFRRRFGVSTESFRRSAQEHGSSFDSRFIHCLTQVLRAYSNREDLMTMLTRVNNAMNKFSSEGGSKRQISHQLSTLKKKVYFPNFLQTK